MSGSEESLFHETLARPANERGAFLGQACAADPALREAVEVLLAAHAAPGSFLDRPALGVVRQGRCARTAAEARRRRQRRGPLCRQVDGPPLRRR
jgi:hypothetical protein